MAVTSGTKDIRQIPVGDKTYILRIKDTFTGDNSGGTVTEQLYITNYIPLGSKVWIIDCGVQHNAAWDDEWAISITDTHWECPSVNTLIAYNPTGISYDSSKCSSNLNKTCQYPVFLGRSLTETPLINFWHEVNTDTKSYIDVVVFLVERP